MKWVQVRILFDGCFTVPSNDRAGGLALLWKNDVDVWMGSFLNYHIYSIVHGGSKNAWRLTRFYGELDTNRRSEGWNS